jgi:hypothetical protein
VTFSAQLAGLLIMEKPKVLDLDLRLRLPE